MPVFPQRRSGGLNARLTRAGEVGSEQWLKARGARAHGRARSRAPPPDRLLAAHSRLPVVHLTTDRPHLPVLPELFELRLDRCAAARGRAWNLACGAACAAVPPVGSRRRGRRATGSTRAGSAGTPALETPDASSSVRTDMRSSTDEHVHRCCSSYQCERTTTRPGSLVLVSQPNQRGSSRWHVVHASCCPRVAPQHTPHRKPGSTHGPVPLHSGQRVARTARVVPAGGGLSLIHISEPTRLGMI